MSIEKILLVKHKSLKVAPDTDKGDDMRTLLIFLLAFVTSTINAQCPDDRHPHLIDLGLPSSTMWACCNLGTNDVNGFGDYFSGDFSSENLKKLLGDTYTIPTIDQLKELEDQCDYKFYTYNGVNGVLFTGKNGNTLFFPAAASYCGSEDGDYSINDEGSGAYWSQSHSNYDDYNDFMEFYYDDWDKDMTVCFGERKSVYNKLPIRAVKASNETSLNGITIENSDIKPYELRVNNGVVTINTNNSNKPTTWEVYNLDATCYNSGSSKKKTICINDLSKGVKIIKISIDGKSWYEKVQITH